MSVDLSKVASRERHIQTLERRWRRRRSARERQIRLFGETGKRGHARAALRHGKAMRKLRDKIDAAELLKPAVWRLAWAARFVARWEGEVLTAYHDSGGVLTIGYGHTGADVYEGQKITHAEALRLLTQDLRLASRVVSRNLKRPLSVRQRIAAISFTFNVGEGGLQISTFLREFNAGNTRAAADALLLWVKDEHGTVLLGLQRRRRLERWLFLHPKKEA